ncbi:serine/threonine protein kinase [Spiractinospora alimapuensis]|uniref:serine/threonine-protein kinase n=1 Tax=Spiractinospora alimapuensis TaxID=2820884 RepID=UPI001F2AC93A|nr:serine/threonine-protein kinase [Spiractinospora alimapuensis]QVQ50273.1 serine/threonine protein kinase [Spiractinospora alimapuensis]
MVEPLLPNDPPHLGPYRVLGRLGAGGQGVVYLATSQDGTQVAIKTLGVDTTEDPTFLQRFAREADAARQVASFCTAAVLDADLTARPPYIVSEYVAGPSIAAAVRTRGPLTGGDLHRVAVAMATALMAIHEAGIVHRDLKPANVLLGDGGARVIDFGVARVSHGTGTATNTSIGTPAYMAPEQIAGDPITPKADVFSWGAVVAFAASGRQPFDGDSVPAILHQVLNGSPDLTGVPESLRDLVSAALNKDPNQRPSSTDVLMTLIGRADRPGTQEAATQVMREGAATAVAPMAGAAPTAVPPGTPQPPGQPATSDDGRPRGRRGPVVAAAAGGLVIGLLLGGVLGWTLSPSDAGPVADDAQAQDDQTDPEQSDAAAAEDTEADDPDDGDTDESPAEVPRFPAEYAGDWIGETPGVEWEASFSEGERSGTVESDDCDYDLLLTETTDEGFEGLMDSDDTGCHQHTFDLSLNNEVLTMNRAVDMAEETIQFERD